MIITDFPARFDKSTSEVVSTAPLSSYSGTDMAVIEDARLESVGLCKSSC